ncbi:MAG: macro domain-containing protein [Candidatus Thorarchaeota archaeon]|nr:MAG: macro domain-containing protein [Candidatus Thorarchaeota archaeon]
MERKLGDVLVRTYLGDITELVVDAIANAANSDLWMGSGVAGAIKAKGGVEIEEEAISLGPIKPGEAVMTTGGKLPAKYVLHCAGMSPGGKATQWKVIESVQNALTIASRHNLKSVAFPAIGAGVGGLSEYDSAKAIITGIYQYARSPHSVKEITLVGLNRYVCECFCKAFDEREE